MRRVWLCDTCLDTYSTKPWKCPLCGVETCENCLAGFNICGTCGEGKSQEELFNIAKEKNLIDLYHPDETFEEYMEY